MVISDYFEIERAYAKLNLYLDVLSKRPDGYHNITGLFQTIDLHDELEISQIDKRGEVRIETNIEIQGTNLIEKAFRTVEKFYNVGFGIKVRLKKNIPMGSGLGGGSSDAAAVLRFLGRKLKISIKDLLILAAEVGSDVPFLIVGGTAIVEGRGEKVTFLSPINDYRVDLFCPTISVSTKFAYQMIHESTYAKKPDFALKLYEAYLKRDHNQIKALSYNVFQEIMTSKYPQIQDALDKAQRCNPIVAMMTGSGSCIFAVQADKGKYRFIEDVFQHL